MTVFLQNITSMPRGFFERNISPTSYDIWFFILDLTWYSWPTKSKYFFVIISVLLMISLICFAQSGLQLAFFGLLTTIIIVISLMVSFMQGGCIGGLIALSIIIIAVPIPVRDALITHRIQSATNMDNDRKETTWNYIKSIGCFCCFWLFFFSHRCEHFQSFTGMWIKTVSLTSLTT